MGQEDALTQRRTFSAEYQHGAVAMREVPGVTVPQVEVDPSVKTDLSRV